MKVFGFFYVFVALMLISFFPITHATTSSSTDFGSLNIDQDQISIPEDSLTIMQISGTANDYKRGVQILLDILKPDGTTDQIKVVANVDGIFATSIILDANWIVGEHTINGVYEGNEIGTVTFTILQIAGPELPSFLDFGTIEIETEELTISKSEKVTIDVYGNINDYEKGELITIEITKPDGTTEIVSVTANKSTGDYVAHISIDGEWPTGDYKIKATHNSNEIGVVNFVLNKIGIPEWVKNNAGWWADGVIGDSDFVSGIQYLITSGVMEIPATETSAPSASQEIPEWVKNTAGWWANDLISDDDFVSGIKYLVENGILSV